MRAAILTKSSAVSNAFGLVRWIKADADMNIKDRGYPVLECDVKRQGS